MSDTFTLGLKFRILVEQLGGEVTENAMYLDGKGNQFAFKQKINLLQLTYGMKV